eukprot:15143132-Heterocapsa_arctica.AAC.1
MQHGPRNRHLEAAMPAIGAHAISTTGSAAACSWVGADPWVHSASSIAGCLAATMETQISS